MITLKKPYLHAVSPGLSTDYLTNLMTGITLIVHKQSTMAKTTTPKTLGPTTKVFPL